MRAGSDGPVLRLRAVAGVSVVLLAWDFIDEPDVTARAALPPAVEDLLGFAVLRETFDDDGKVSERSFLRGIKRFRDKDSGLAPGTPVRTDEHPIQSFLWADYTPEAATNYRYTVRPVHGPHAKLLDVREPQGTSVRITTEPVHDGRNGVSRQDMYFNRGVIGSQAFEREFPGVDPKATDPASAPMVWLSRGLFEGLLAFIAQALDERFALRGAFYEFRYQPAVDAFGQALENGADVQIVYEAEGGNGSYRDENEVALGRAGLLRPGVAIPRTQRTGIRHNKFAVLLKDENPVAVWTGSTNISEGGIFGHTNIGHVVRDARVAQAYLDYWEALAGDPTVGALRKRALALTPAPPPVPSVGVTPLFSPRDGDKATTTLDWYASLIARAKRLVCMTLAFNFDQVFQTVMAPESDVLRYIVKDKDLADDEAIGHDHDLLFAAGGRLPEGALAGFLSERGNPLNTNDYIHTKVLLVDPLGAEPVVVTGSANFSRPSQRTNDENMLVIRGDTRVADCYLGEYMRIFDHHYARYVVAKLKASRGDADPDAGYLKSKAAEWLPAHFSSQSYKSKRRRYFTEDPEKL
jgi:phosphatidylserine/phosphatidylglycerophosphate/cardiolipin synthase-like enzyme